MIAKSSILIRRALFFSIILTFAVVTVAQNVAPNVEIKGQLLDVDGRPMANANVTLSTRSLDVNDARFPSQPLSGDQLLWARTDAQGQFTFPAQNRNYILFAATDAGYAIAKAKTLTLPVSLRLARWSRLEGVVRVGQKTAPAGSVVEAHRSSVEFQDEIGPYLHFRTTTDASGRFVFNRVLEGDYRVASHMKLQTATLGASGQASVLPGSSASVEVISTGRTVKGRIAMPEGFQAQTWHVESPGLDHEVQLPRSISLMTNFSELDQAGRQAAIEQWRQSAEGQRVLAEYARLRSAPQIGVMIESDGSFVIEQMPAGNYMMPVFFYPRAAGQIDYQKHRTALAFHFTNPPIPGVVDETPLELGTLPAQLRGRFNAGQVAPEIQIPTVDGKQLLLSQYKGKVVLLDFWGVWCGACHQDLPNLQAIHSRFGNDPNFVMIGLSVDDEAGKLQGYLQTNRMPWIQGILGDSQRAWQLPFYFVRGYPTYWLIGPNGTVIGMDTFRSDGLAPLIEKALADLKAGR